MSNEYIDDANEVINREESEPITLEAYLDAISDTPSQAAHSSRYLLNAIEAAGTREVIENSARKTRWCFFDDPYDGGKNAVIGHTDLINDFVADLRQMAENPSRQKSFWLNGPTGSGKSAFKHCLINGLKAYSKTEAGRRYTVEWNIATRNSGHDLSFGQTSDSQLDEENWYQSPVQPNPLTVFPKSVRSDILTEMREKAGYPLYVNEKIDPFSEEVWNVLKSHYDPSQEKNLFKSLTGPRHLRVRPYTVDIGSGIGVLSAEDHGTPTELLAGTWLEPLLRTLPYRGRRNPQAFSYDGLLAQGNTGLSIIEDAGLHSETIQRLLSVSEEKSVQIDRQLSIDVDTVLFIISNPDLALYLESYLENEIADPLRPVRRRLHRYELNYLIDPALENELLRRNLTGDNTVWRNHSRHQLEEPITLDSVEFAPHTIETAAFYSVVSRLDGLGVPDEMSFLDKALVGERGFALSNDGKPITRDHLSVDGELTDGSLGLPTTFVQSVLSELTTSVNSPILPHEIIRVIHDEIPNYPVFSDDEITEYQWRAKFATPFAIGKQAGDMKAAFFDTLPTETVGEYLTHIIDWARDQENETPELTEIEAIHFGWIEPFNEVHRTEFRRRVLAGLNYYLWDTRSAPRTTDELDTFDPTTQKSVFKTLSWDDALRRWPQATFTDWESPHKNSHTFAAKDACLNALVDSFGYSQQAATRMTSFIVKHELTPDDD